MASAEGAQRRKGLARTACRVRAVERPSDSLVLLELERPKDYVFEPGQFLYVYRPGDEERRAYSIASPPEAADRLDLCIKKVDGPLSGFLYEVEPGATLEVTKALGGFRFASKPGRTAVFLATGTGAAPLRSMILDELPRSPDREMWLFLGSRREVNLPYRTEFERLERDHERFHFVPVLSGGPPEWTGDRGWIQEAYLHRFRHRRDFDVYVCGVKRMVDDVVEMLKERGFERDQLHFERYV